MIAKSFWNHKKLFLILPFLLCFFLLPFLKIDYSKDLNNQSFSTKKIKASDDINFDYSIEQVSTGYEHGGAVVKYEGSDHLYTWGKNNKGQLGLGDVKTRTTPQEVIELPSGDIEQISMGHEYSAAIVDNKLYTWGNNEYGQLGLGNTIDYKIPQKVGTLPKGNIEQISMQGDSAAALINDGGNDSLYTWGNNSWGKNDSSEVGFGLLGLGDGYTEDYYNIPQEVKGLSNKGNIEQVVMDDDHSAVIVKESDGKDHLYTWGKNQWGQLGFEEKECSLKEPSYNAPQKVPFFEKNKNVEEINQISLGTGYSGAFTTDYRGNTHLYTWGANKFGQLGYGKNKYDKCEYVVKDEQGEVTSSWFYYTSPHEVIDFPTENLGEITQISFGTNFSSAVVTNDGVDELYTWGQDQLGQLGIGSRIDNDDPFATKNTPQQVSLLDDDIKQISMGRHYGFAITSDGTNDSLYSWGSNDYGQLGLNDRDNRNTPELIYETPYISNIKAEVTTDPKLNPNAGELIYSFETPLAVEDVTIKLTNSNGNPVMEAFNSTPKEIATNLYSGKGTFYNLKKGEEYTYEVYLNYWNYQKTTLEDPVLIAKGSFIKDFWEYNKWFIFFIVVILLILIMLIATITYITLKIRKTNLLKRRTEKIRKTIIKETNNR